MHRIFFAAAPLVLAVLASFASSPEKVPTKPATYSDEVARILNKNCVTCHRPGEVAPFSLVGYDNAKKHAATIAAATSQRIMPPWKAIEGHGEFQNTKRLTDAEIAT